MCHELPLGEKTSVYPHGYGFCQCGCEKLTQMNSDHLWISYIDGHQPIQITAESEPPLTGSFPKVPQESSLQENDLTSAVLSQLGEVNARAFNVSKEGFPSVTLPSLPNRYIYAERGLLDA
jgi:hypothetical protein